MTCLRVGKTCRCRLLIEGEGGCNEKVVCAHFGGGDTSSPSCRHHIHVRAHEPPSRFLQPTVVRGNASGPQFDAPYTTRRICVDHIHDGIATSTLNRAAYLSGGELVGAPVAATDPDGDGLASYLGLEDDGQDFMFFDYATSSGQLFVSAAGADDRLGLDADQVYPVIVTAADGRGKWDAITVGVWIDSSTPSPSGDGLCP